MLDKDEVSVVIYIEPITVDHIIITTENIAAYIAKDIRLNTNMHAESTQIFDAFRNYKIHVTNIRSLDNKKPYK